MTTSMQCFVCKHLHPGERFTPDGFMTCEAFPDGLPEEIASFGFDHSKPFPGDKGIRFELREGVDFPGDEDNTKNS